MQWKKTRCCNDNCFANVESFMVLNILKQLIKKTFCDHSYIDMKLITLECDFWTQIMFAITFIWKFFVQKQILNDVNLIVKSWATKLNGAKRKFEFFWAVQLIPFTLISSSKYHKTNLLKLVFPYKDDYMWIDWKVHDRT